MSNKGFVLLNRQTNMVISADDRVPVRLTTFQNWKRGTWKFTDTRAIELQENTDMNLNVYVTGKDPQHVPAGAQIYAWNWGNNFNERWKFALIDGA